MKNEYGELMAHLLRQKGRYAKEQEFRAFVAESVRTFARDLREFDPSISFSPDHITSERGGKDWNALKVGCE
ncbi:MAG TPA: hypothetical protein VJZ26_11470 [Blastocatellia bacterium]|nr:hypothetical protein [Blastocatellia bacterium]